MSGKMFDVPDEDEYLAIERALDTAVGLERQRLRERLFELLGIETRLRRIEPET